MDFAIWFLSIFSVLAYFHLSAILYKLDRDQKALFVLMNRTKT